MLAAYGVDVLDPAVSTRRVAVLLDRLPPYARRYGEHWSTEAELLAVLVDAVQELTWVTLKAAGAKNVNRPRPIPRPGSAARRAVAPSAAPPSADGAARSPSWHDAARQLAAIPGVIVDGQL